MLKNFFNLFILILSMTDEERKDRSGANVILALGGLFFLGIFAGIIFVIVMLIWPEMIGRFFGRIAVGLLNSMGGMSQQAIGNLLATIVIIAIPLAVINFMTGGMLGWVFRGFIGIFKGGKKKK